MHATSWSFSLVNLSFLELLPWVILTRSRKSLGLSMVTEPRVIEFWNVLCHKMPLWSNLPLETEVRLRHTRAVQRSATECNVKLFRLDIFKFQIWPPHQLDFKELHSHYYTCMYNSDLLVKMTKMLHYLSFDLLICTRGNWLWWMIICQGAQKNFLAIFQASGGRLFVRDLEKLKWCHSSKL